MEYINGKWKQVCGFVYYRNNTALNYCFAHPRRYKTLKFGASRLEENRW